MTKKSKRAEEEIKDELKKMAQTDRFRQSRGEFSEISDGLVARHGDNPDSAWKEITDRIIEFLPAYLTDGLIQCSRETIKTTEEYKKGIAEQASRLVIKPGKKFPKIPYPSFYPYLEFILRWDSFDVLKWKKTFKVEGSVQLQEVMVLLDNEKITGITGTIIASFTLPVCKGKTPWELYTCNLVRLHLE